MKRARHKEVLNGILLAFFAMAACARGLGQLYPLPAQTPAQTARVQQMLLRFSSPGKWDTQIKWMGRDSMYELTQAGPRALTARRILDIFQRAAFLDPPQGFDVQVHLMGVGQGPLDFHRDDVEATGWHPGAFRLSFDLFPGTAKQAGETGMHIIIDVNFIPAASDPGNSRGTSALKPVAIDRNGPILRGPTGGERQIGNFRGFALLADGHIVLTKNRAPMYVPVSREEYLVALFADYKKRSEAGESRYLTNEMNSLTAVLAGMTATDRAAEAWIGCRGPATLCADNDPLRMQAFPLRRVNRAFFDSKLSADSVQLISIRTGQTLDPYAQYIFQRIWDTLDWESLSNILSN